MPCPIEFRSQEIHFCLCVLSNPFQALHLAKVILAPTFLWQGSRDSGPLVFFQAWGNLIFLCYFFSTWLWWDHMNPHHFGPLFYQSWGCIERCQVENRHLLLPVAYTKSTTVVILLPVATLAWWVSSLRKILNSKQQNNITGIFRLYIYIHTHTHTHFSVFFPLRFTILFQHLVNFHISRLDELSGGLPKIFSQADSELPGVPRRSAFVRRYQGPPSAKARHGERVDRVGGSNGGCRFSCWSCSKCSKKLH